MWRSGRGGIIIYSKQTNQVCFDGNDRTELDRALLYLAGLGRDWPELRLNLLTVAGYGHTRPFGIGIGI